jgi:phospholipase C
MFVISPWSRGGWVNSQVFDHTSVLRFLEARFGVKEPNIGPFRRAVCGDLTSAFNFATPNTEALPVLQGRKDKSQPGRRPARRPAAPGADRAARVAAAAGAGRRHTALACPALRTGDTCAKCSRRHDGCRARGAELHQQRPPGRRVPRVRPQGPGGLPRRYTVERANRWSDVDWIRRAGRAYDLWVLGPNGYHRGFAGELPGAGVAPEIQVCYDLSNAAVYVKLRNTGTAPARFTIKPMAYRQDGSWTVTVQPGAEGEQHWSLADSGNWYDFEVSVDVQPTFRRRFAGRLETGKDTVSDPAMGMSN